MTLNWEPAADPDPQAIIQEARLLAAKGQYLEALARHLWLHRHALRHRPAWAGVRLSFALSDWIKLGLAYPPAMAALENIRNECYAYLREDRPENTEQFRCENPAHYEAFLDFHAISRALRQPEKTRDLFFWLESHKPEMAAQVYSAAEQALVETGEYRICGRYLNPDASLERAVELYRMGIERARNPRFGEREAERNKKKFSRRVCTLVALLILNERATEAEQVANLALRELQDTSFEAQLKEAKRGHLPPR